MGGCWSQQSIESEAMLAEVESCSVVERSAGDGGGSSEYVGAYVGNGMAQQNTVEPMLPVSNDQPEQPVLRVSPNVYQNSTEPMFDFPIVNTGSTNVDQPIIYQTFEEQPIVEETVYQIFKEQPTTLPVSNNQVEALPAVSDVIDYQNGNEVVLDAPIETTLKTIVDEPLYQPFEEHPVDERTLNNRVIKEQPVIDTPIFEEQPVHPISFEDHAVPAQSSETPASVEVDENMQVVESQPPGQDLGIVFEGRTYRTRIFDPNLQEHVYVGEDYVKPRGGLVM